MSKSLPLPQELAHLIEKREAERDRRAEEDRREADLGTLGAIESAESLDDVPTEERRDGQERRIISRRQTD